MNPAGMMNLSVTVTPRTATVQSSGTSTYADGTTFTSIASIVPKSSSESDQYMRQSGVEYAVGYFPFLKGDGSALTIGHEYLVTWGSKVYRVKGPSRDAGGRGVFQIVDLEREV